MEQRLFAVAIADFGSGVSVEFYWADDSLHAEEQAEDACSRSEEVVAVAQVPREYTAKLAIHSG